MKGSVMTMNKKISLYFAVMIMMMFQLTNCTNKQKDDSPKYLKRSDKNFNYEVIKHIKPAPEGARSHRAEVIFDEKFPSLFGEKLNRKKITSEIQGRKTIVITEIWTSKRHTASRVGAAKACAGYNYMDQMSSIPNEKLIKLESVVGSARRELKRSRTERDREAIKIETLESLKDLGIKLHTGKSFALDLEKLEQRVHGEISLREAKAAAASVAERELADRFEYNRLATSQPAKRTWAEFFSGSKRVE